MNDWKYLFRPHILERGFDYYVVGAVDEVERTKTGYRANVEGTEDYEVEIELRDGDVYDMNCTCPFSYTHLRNLTGLFCFIRMGKLPGNTQR